MVVSKCEMQEVELIREELHSSLTEMVDYSPTSSATEQNTKPHQVVKCPRCDSFNTKFCYYNNYSLTQPRYFCKNCKRYWTKGGSLRNIPVGGGCRKNKRSKQRITDQPQRAATATAAIRAGGRGSVEESSTKTVSSGAATTVSGDNSSATNAPTFSGSDGCQSPNTPLPQDVMGCCVTSGYLKLPAHGEEAPSPSFVAINTNRDGSPKTALSQIGSSATSGFMTSAGDEEERARVSLNGEEIFCSSLICDAAKTNRSQQQNFSSNPLIFSRQEFSNLPLFLPCNSIPQLDGLPSVDSALLAFNFPTPESPMKPDQNFIQHNNNGDLSQVFGTLAHSICNVSPIPHTESILVSGLGADLINRSNLGFHWRLQNHEHCHLHHHHHQQQQQQQKQQDQKPSVMPADQFLQSTIDEQTWRRMIEDASTENFGQMRENFSLAGSQILPYEFGNVAFDWQSGSEDFFDPTSDVCYMGGPGVWPDFSPFGAGSATLI